MQINNSPKRDINFKAVKVATAKNTLGKITTDIEIYKLQKEDRSFLENLKKKTSIKKMYPKLDSLAQARWQHIFEYCINNILDSFGNRNTAYLAVKNKKPCGIMTYTDKGSELYLDGICSIPIEENKKVSLVGKTLFLQFFKDLEKSKAKKATLSAVNDGPFNVVKKYQELGFVKDMTTHPYSLMVCNKYKAKEQQSKLSKVIDYTNSPTCKINLEDITD